MVVMKAYGGFAPVEEDACLLLRKAACMSVGTEPDEAYWYEAGELRISFEGLYFPEEDIIAALSKVLPVDAQGRLDVLDLDAWTITRYRWSEQDFVMNVRGLNHVLDHAGL